MPSPPVARVATRQHALVARFREAARGSTTGRDLVVLEGATLVAEAHRAGWTIEAAAFTDASLADGATSALFEALADATRVVVPGRVLEAMSPARTPSGVVALGRARRRPPDDLFTPPPALVLVAIDVQDPGNLGAIVRAAEAAGATGVIAAGASADPLGWKALRGAMGSLFRLPVARMPEVERALAVCRDHRLTLVATVLEGTPLDQAPLGGPCAVLLGTEGRGLPPAIVDAVDATLTIPMVGPVESLNVAVAAGIILYEARRQREAGGRGAQAEGGRREAVGGSPGAGR